LQLLALVAAVTTEPFLTAVASTITNVKVLYQVTQVIGATTVALAAVAEVAATMHKE
jgi:hypothetical protein